MTFVDTEPADIDSDTWVGPWERFRVDDPRRCLAALNDVCRTDVPVTLGTGNANGPTVKASLWSVDPGAGRLIFSIDPTLTHVSALAALPQAWAALYLGDVKLQFPLRDLVLGPAAPVKRIGSPASRALQSALPTYAYFMPRRQALRIRHDRHRGPILRFAHPLLPSERLNLSMLDLSATGCALLQPAGTPWLPAGAELVQVEVELDDENFLFVDLTVQHVTVAGSDDQPHARVGCRWHSMSRGAQDVLERWLRSGRRSRDLITLKFD